MPTTNQPPRAELRTHYRRIEQMIRRERAAREHVLRSNPNLAAKLAECDNALASLEIMGQAIAHLLPPEAEQAALIDGADAPRSY
jgi:hypothetical protein